MRRKALRDALHRATMSPAEAARAAGLRTPNAIYNFLGGRSHSLSSETYERLARAIPQTTLAELQGLADHREDVPAAIGLVEVRAMAAAGLMQPAFDLPQSQRLFVSVPVTEVSQASGAFALIVHEPGAEKLFPDQTILVCIPSTTFEGTIVDGQKLVLQRIRGGRVEVTVRELALEANEAWLWLRSTHPDCQVPIRMPWTPENPFRPWRVGEDRYALGAVAILACVPLAGEPYRLDAGPKRENPLSR